MITVTKKQRENALYVRDVLWPSIPPDLVLPDLYPFSWGRKACLGGWVARSPYFEAQGVSASDCGIPMLGSLLGTDTAVALFGDRTLFFAREVEFGDPEGVSGHEVARLRIERLIANSVVEEEVFA